MCGESPGQEEDSVRMVLQPIVVTSTRIPTNDLFVSRSIDVIDEQTIQNSGAWCVEDLLQNGANVDVQSRGVFGVQTDVSIRGALYSQYLLLLDGVRLNDSQTSHHNFDLPVSPDQIQRIEVLKGPGSSLYGPDAFGGVINIITRVPAQTACRLNLSGGENGLVHAAGSYDYSSSGIHSSNTIEHRRSDGYHVDTDFQTTSISSNNTMDFPFGTCSLFGGYAQKAFGAFNFYGPSPSKEWTTTTFCHAAAQILVHGLLLQPKISYRRHNDKFMYDVRTPGQFVNIHTTNSSSGELHCIIPIDESSSLISGIAGTIDNIVSTNLHTHERSSLGILLSLQCVFRQRFLVDVGMREDFHSQYGRQLNPAMSVGVLFAQSAKVFVTAGRSFRAPSYTELYYSNPARIGNAGLKPETGWSTELGTEWYGGAQIKFSASCFERDQQNLIDYVKFTASDAVAQAANFATAVTRGLEAALQWQRGDDAEPEIIRSVQVRYTYLDSRIDRGSVYSSVYSFNHPRHQLNVDGSGYLPFLLHWTTNLTHKIKMDGTAFSLVDAKVSRDLSVATVFLQGTNLLNQSYEELTGVPLPGRWIWAGIEIKLL
ncbi:MAG: TonB-dependent receptor [Ignavibacteriae bacterium]|nr:MAG: TonB-dependent receptor [Ignavibacteriota bacterium]